MDGRLLVRASNSAAAARETRRLAAELSARALTTRERAAVAAFLVSVIGGRCHGSCDSCITRARALLARLKRSKPQCRKLS